MGETCRQMRLSVRELVEFVLRSGDIDNRRSVSGQKEAILAGGRIHRKIQKRMGAGYRAEVMLRYLAKDPEQEVDLLIEGRADGIFEEDGMVVIDEIKGMYRDIWRLEEPVPVHLAQAMCYGWFYCCEKELEEIRLQLTYCNLETEEVRRFQTERSKEELERWFQSLIHEYFKWARYQNHHETLRNQSIRALEFPYPYRAGQRDLVVAVYRSIAREKRLFIQAPTGIGKTLSVVFPAVKAIGEGKGDKLFYLTAKTVTRMAAEDAFRILRENGLDFTTVTITAKEKLCPMEQMECNPESCPRAKGHFDRVNEAVFDILHLEQDMTRERILAYAARYQVCPFEFGLDISNWTDGIICDYNYVFDPNVRLKRYFSEGNGGNYLFLVDEAHNLVSRARDMYSASVKKEDVLEVKRIVKKLDAKLVKLLEGTNRILLSMKRECESWRLLEDVTPLAAGLKGVFAQMEIFLEEHTEFEEREIVLDFYFGVRDFLDVYERLDDHYRMYAEYFGQSFFVRLFCVNPSRRLSECMEQGRSSILFSATFLPIPYYKMLLSGRDDDYAVYAESPFLEEKRLLMVASDVSSRYTRRTESEYRKVAEYIRAVVRAKTGNYMIFFPSYEYMGHVERMLEDDPLEADLLVQGSGMNEEERQEFLREFEKKREYSLAAFCVMGGVFSEGIDLTRERLIGVVIVGTGLPMLSVEQEILRGYFEETNSDGFAYAFRYPGMNKVLQAAGRVIRTAEDEGIILLLDDRFLQREYLDLFPREWEHYHVVSQWNVGQCLEDFWKIREITKSQ